MLQRCRGEMLLYLSQGFVTSTQKVGCSAELLQSCRANLFHSRSRKSWPLAPPGCSLTSRSTAVRKLQKV